MRFSSSCRASPHALSLDQSLKLDFLASGTPHVSEFLALVYAAWKIKPFSICNGMVSWVPLSPGLMPYTVTSPHGYPRSSRTSIIPTSHNSLSTSDEFLPPNSCYPYFRGGTPRNREVLSPTRVPAAHGSLSPLWRWDPAPWGRLGRAALVSALSMAWGQGGGCCKIRARPGELQLRLRSRRCPGAGRAQLSCGTSAGEAIPDP